MSCDGPPDVTTLHTTYSKIAWTDAYARLLAHQKAAGVSQGGSNALQQQQQQQLAALQQQTQYLAYYQMYATREPEKAFVFTADQIITYQAQIDFFRGLQSGNAAAVTAAQMARCKAPTLREQATGLRRAFSDDRRPLSWNT